MIKFVMKDGSLILIRIILSNFSPTSQVCQYEFVILLNFEKMLNDEIDIVKMRKLRECDEISYSFLDLNGM